MWYNRYMARLGMQRRGMICNAESGYGAARYAMGFLYYVVGSMVGPKGFYSRAVEGVKQ